VVIRRLILLIAGAVSLAACTSTIEENYQIVPSRNHATSTNGAGYNIQLDEQASKLTVSLDLQSAASTVLVKGVTFGQSQGSADDAEFETIGKDWARANKPKCQLKNGRRVDTVHYQFDLDCAAEKDQQKTSK